MSVHKIFFICIHVLGQAEQERVLIRVNLSAGKAIEGNEIVRSKQKKPGGCLQAVQYHAIVEAHLRRQLIPATLDTLGLTLYLRCWNMLESMLRVHAFGNALQGRY